jgi:integrase
MNGGTRKFKDGHYARLTIPEEYRVIIGKREFLAKLPEARTKAQAERLAVKHHEKWESIIALARNGEWPSIPQEDLEGIAAEFWTWAAIYHWTAHRLLTENRLDEVLRRFLVVTPPKDSIRAEIPIRVGGGHYALLRDLIAVQMRLSLPGGKPTRPRATVTVTYTWKQLFRDWAKDTGKITNEQPDLEKNKTCYSWQKIIAKLMTHIGHDNAAAVTHDDRIAWKDALVNQGDLSPITIRNHLIIAQTLLNWAWGNKKIPLKPEPVRYKAKRKQGTKKRGYTDEEAKTILLAARRQMEPHIRWCPWLCAFNGARISEVSAAMVADIVKVRGVACIHFRVDNRKRDLKNEGSERIIPIHSAVLAEGFLDYVAGLDRKGPLFPNVAPDRFGNRGGIATKDIGSWVRHDLGLTDKRLAPNHSWRHRFESEHRALKIRDDVTDAITGHHDGEAATDYGEHYVRETLQPAIEALKSPQ